jgi:hypothetical protein
MRRNALAALAIFAALAARVSVAGPAHAVDIATATVGGASATAVSPWASPRGCSQFRVDYANLPADAVASIRVLDTATRADIGGAFILDTSPRSGAEAVQVCRADAEGVTTMILQLDVSEEGIGESVPFGWTRTTYATPVTPSRWRCGADVPASAVVQCIATYRSTLARAPALALAEASRAGIGLMYAPAAVRRTGGIVTVVAVVAKVPR